MAKTIAIISHFAPSLIGFRGPLIRDLVATGAKVYALAPDFDDNLREQVRNLGAEPIDYSLSRTGMNPFRDILDTFRLAVLLRRLRPDVTLGYTIKPVIYGTIAAWLARVPRRVAMITGLGYVFTPSGASSSWSRTLLRTTVLKLYTFALAKVDRVIFQNPDDLKEFTDAGVVSQDKAVNAGGTGVDLQEWPLSPPVTKPVTFLLAARLLREKGILEYVEAARTIKARYPEVRFILLGGLDTNPGGISAAEVHSWVDEGLLEWPGHVNVKPWFEQMSVYVLPSYREGVPRSTQEAMAMGRPVITTDAPGCRETVEHGVNGFLVPPRDVEALVAAMERFIKEPALIETMGKESRRLAEERFDVRKVNARLMEFIMPKDDE